MDKLPKYMVRISPSYETMTFLGLARDRCHSLPPCSMSIKIRAYSLTIPNSRINIRKRE